MMTLKQAMLLSKSEQNNLKSEIQKVTKLQSNIELNAYIDFSDDGFEGVPILITCVEVSCRNNDIRIDISTKFPSFAFDFCSHTICCDVGRILRRCLHILSLRQNKFLLS